jgi:dienelactone hydrolase
MIATVLPGTVELEESADRRDAQWRQLREWYDRRLAAIEPEKPTPDDVLEAFGITKSNAFGAAVGTIALGPKAAPTLVVLATAEPLAPGTSAWAAAAATRARVAIPAFVRRTRRDAVCRRLGKDRRHILHHLAFPLGWTLAGLQAEAIADFVRETRAERVILVGVDDGVRTVRLASLLVADRPRVELVVAPSDDVPSPVAGGPIDRLVRGDAWLGAPERWPETAPTTVVRASEIGGDILRRLGATPAAGDGHGLDDRIARASNRTFTAWLDRLRHETLTADGTRAERSGLVGTRPRDRPRVAAALRETLRQSVEGRDVLAHGRRAPVRTRRLRVSARFVAYQVLIDTGYGFDAWGHLLVPRGSLRRAPAVIAQHGLGGSPGDVTGIGAAAPPETDAYHAFGARLAERGYVVFAPYLTVPEPQDDLINPLVVAATTLGEQRSRVELIKLRAILDWLATQAFVRADRIGYYGLSYGGHAALWIAGLDERLRAVVVSGHANDWTAKTTDLDDPRSFMAHPDEDFTVWGATRSISHLELVAAAWPRPTLIEAGSDDPITNDAWFGRIERELRTWSSDWRTPERLEIERFEGIHEVTGAASLEFLDRWLRPERAFVRDYVYELPAARDLPGIGDISSDRDPFVSGVVAPGTSIDVVIPIARRRHFAGAAFRLSSAADPGELESVRVTYRTACGQPVGETVIEGDRVYPLWDLWHEARIEAHSVSEDVVASIEPQGAGVVVYGPKALGARDRRLRPAVRPAGTSPKAEPTHEFARAMLDGPSADFAWNGLPPSTSFRVAPSPHELATRWVRESLTPVAHEVESGEQVLVELAVDAALDGGPRSHRVEIGDRLIRLTGQTHRALLAAANTLRGRVSADRALRPASLVRSEVVLDRVTTGVLPAGTRYREADLPSSWTDGALERVAKSGFTGIWSWVNLEDVTLDSTALPELNDPASDQRIARLDRLAARAARFGLDTWVYLAIGYRQPPSEAFWAAHPELRGGDGWMGPTMCSSNPVTLRHQREVVERLLREAPGITGLFVIFDIEGFYFCGSEEPSRLACPRCRTRTPEELAREVLVNLDEAVRAAPGNRRLVAWSYGWRSDWVARLVPTLPPSIEFQADFSKGVPVRRGGVELPAGDDTIAEVGPSPVFERLRAASTDRTFWAKGEHAISLDAVFVPYLPGLDQFVARAAAMRASGAEGWLANWIHYGFLEPMTAELLNRHAFNPPPGDELLDGLAAARYGRAAVDHAHEAWRAFSDAIRAFPYSDPVARSPGPFQKGPTHPLWLTADPAGRGRWRSWQNDLDWTAPFGPDIVRASFAAMERHQRRGLTALRRALPATSGADRDRLRHDIDLALVWWSAVETMIAVIDATRARDDLPTFRRIADRHRRRLRPVRAALERESRLGFAQDGGGVIRGGLFTPSLLDRTTGTLDDLLA